MPKARTPGTWVTLFASQVLTGAAFEELLAALGDFEALAELEGVVIGDDDGGLLDLVGELLRHQFARDVVVLRIVRLENAEAVFDGESRGDDEEAAGELPAAWTARGIDRPCPSSNPSSDCAAAPLRFFGFGIGVMNSARRCCFRIVSVGWPDGSNSQCRCGGL